MAISTRPQQAKAKSFYFQEHITTRDTLNTLFFYRSIAFKIFLTTLMLSVCVSLLIHPTYRSETKLLTLFAGYYNQSNKDTFQPQLAEGQIASVEAQILNSPELARAVVRAQLPTSASVKTIEKARIKFQHHLHLEQDDLANVVTISYSDSSPQQAAKMLKALLNEYFKERASIFTSGKVSSLNEQRDILQKKLKQLNIDLVSFQEHNNLVSPEDQVSNAIALSGFLKQRSLENDTALTQDRHTLASLIASAQNVPNTILLFTDNTEEAHAIDTMQIALLQLESRRADLASRYDIQAPFVKQIDQQIKDVRDSIAKQRQHLKGTERFGHNSYFDTVQDRLAVVTSNIKGEAARAESLQKQLAISTKEIQKMIASTNKLNSMLLQKNLLTESLRTLSKQIDTATIDAIQAESANLTNVRVIQEPSVPTQRSNPLSMFVAASLILSLVVACLAVMVLASTRETFLSPEQVERALHIPVLFSPIIAIFKYGKGSSQNSIHTPSSLYARVINAIDSGANNGTKFAMLLEYDSEDKMAEILRGIAIELEQRSEKPIIILDLASALEKKEYELSFSDQESLAKHLSDHHEKDFMHDDSLSMLEFSYLNRHNIIIARWTKKVTYLSPQQINLIFSTLRNFVDYVLIHTAPVRNSFTGIEFSKKVDKTFLTLKAEKTRKPVVINLARQIQEAGGTVCGVIMTDRKSYIPPCIYRFL
ncbi:MAG: hypothetical protein ABF802_08370 [Acetobacter orientalis]|uniref:exopolysaccharide transport family protein n=1 Tax=Acetobacter orientalis TaxID=146474 RepID=UPI0039E7DFBB